MNSEFTDLKLTLKNLDTYVIRSAIFKDLNRNLKNLSGKVLDVGCGKMPYKKFILENSAVTEYVGLDIDAAIEYDKEVKPDITWDGKSMPIGDNEFDCCIATEVLEHCFEPEILLNEVYRVLKSGGKFIFTVPFLWNLHEVPNDHYRYTPYSLERLLQEAGFSKIKLSAHGGWHASMAQMLGLWVRRSNMSHSKRKFLSIIIKPIIKFMLKVDKNEDVTFRDGQMISGISGFATKNN